MEIISDTLSKRIKKNQQLSRVLMLFGGMITSNPLFLFLIIPTLVIVFILALVNGELIYNILVYGKFSEPCVCGCQTMYPLVAIWGIFFMIKN